MRSSRGKAPLRMTPVASDVRYSRPQKTRAQDDASDVGWDPHDDIYGVRWDPRAKRNCSK